MEENINALDELNKGACLGRDAIEYTLDKVEDRELKKELTNEHEQYNQIVEKANKLYEKYNSNNSEPHKPGVFAKTMTWWGIEMKTFMDQSNSKIAELILQGTNMGIIEGRRMLNNKKIDDEIHSLIEEFVTMQEKFVETLKTFL